jgi:hypothetical protein
MADDTKVMPELSKEEKVALFENLEAAMAASKDSEEFKSKVDEFKKQSLADLKQKVAELKAQAGSDKAVNDAAQAIVDALGSRGPFLYKGREFSIVHARKRDGWEVRTKNKTPEEVG